MRAIDTKNQSGFTLIELMIVVGIIGILVAIAAPNFAKYQSKSRQAEAKIALAAVYGAEKSFYSEYSGYNASLDAVGYAPEGLKRFYSVGFAAATTSVAGYSGSMNGNLSFNRVNYSSFNCGGSMAALGAASGADPQTFYANAAGCVRNGASAYDNWTINDGKILKNTTIAL